MRLVTMSQMGSDSLKQVKEAIGKGVISVIGKDAMSVDTPGYYRCQVHRKGGKPGTAPRME